MIPKLRIYDKKKKRMLDDFTLEIDKYGVTVLDKLGYVVDEDDRIINQSTGLTDKNGVEIFEGDILRRSKLSKTMASTGVVEYIQKEASWGVDIWYLKDWHQSSEVIGNIYEHPGLIERGEE